MRANQPVTSQHPVLVYDGDCAFCAHSIRRVLARDRRGLLRFAARNGEYGRALLARHPQLVDVDSLLWVEPERDGREEVHTRFDAVLGTARYLGGISRLLEVARLIPGPLRDAAYRLVARHRHRLRHQDQTCVVATAAERPRFLD
jgi:predicted DCC family thiol-disulfide oxidoreductase YuxK